jgi:L-fucose isomerase-like protein
MKKLKIVLVSAIWPSFWGSARNQFNDHYAPGMYRISTEMGFELDVLKKPLFTYQDAQEAKKEILALNADFLLIQLTTFAGGEVVEVLADTGLPIGLWGIPEIADSGPIPLNSFCGINMYASILGQYVGKNTKLKWFYGDLTDGMFLKRLRLTVRALTAIKNIRGSRIGLVGGIAPGYYNLYYDERKTKDRLGIKVERQHEFDDVKTKALSYSETVIRPIIEDMRKESRCVSVDAEASLDHTARVYKAIEDIIRENDFQAVAIGCWPKYRKELGIVICSIIGRLLQKGYVAGCEGDIDSTISMLFLKSINGENPAMMDLSKFNLDKEEILMWHCGSAPNTLADGQGACLSAHYKPGSNIVGADDIRVGTAADMYFKPQPATVCRLTWDYRQMLLFSGEFVDNTDRSYDGSRGWIGKLKMEGKPLMVKDLINTIMTQRVQHHYAIIPGNIENEMRDILAWLDIKPLKVIPYNDYMETMPS